MSLQCQKIEIKKLPFLASDITNFTSAVCAVVAEMSSAEIDPIFETWFHTYSSAFVKLSGDVMYGGLSSPNLSTDTLYVGENTIKFFDQNGNIIESLNAQNVTDFKSNFNTVLTYSADWSSVYNTFNTQSAYNESVYATVNSESSFWDETYNNFSSQSANNLSNYSNSNANSGNWNYAYHTVLTGGYIGGNLAVDGNLSAHTFDVDYIDFNNTISTPPYQQGRLFYDQVNSTLTLYVDNPECSMQIGQEMWVKAVNKTQTLLPNGTVVYLSGAQGNRPLMWPALATTELKSADTIGVLTVETVNNAEGYVTTEGVVRGIDTRNFREGEVLYLSPTTPGALTDIRPIAPQHLVKVGYALNTTVNGSILVSVDNGYELDELHNVRIVNPLNGQIISYNSASGLWMNTNLTSSYLPISGGTVLGNVNILGSLSASNTLYSSGGNSNQWNSVYSTVHDNSASLWNYQGTDIKVLTANWEDTYNSFSSQSSNNISVFSTVNSNSGSWASNNTEVSNLVTSTSGNWNSTYTTVNINSGDWNYQGTDIKALTSNWQNTYNTFNSQSGNYESVYSTVNSNSSTTWNYQGTDIKVLTADWQNTYSNFNSQSSNNISVFTTVNTKSANWETTYNTVQDNSASWSITGNPEVDALVTTTSGEWNSVYSTVNANSSTTWNYQGTDIKVLTANWEDTYNAFSTQSGNNISVYNTVNSNSSTWAGGGGGDANVNTFVYNNSATILDVNNTVQTNSGNWNYQGTDIKALTSNWESVYTSFNAQSGNNDSVYNTVNTNSSTTWNYQGTDIKALTSNWENTYNQFASQSGNNISVYNNVQTNSGNWNYQGTDIKALTSNWESVYTNFSVQSGNNISVYNTFNSNSGNYNSVYSTVNSNSAITWNYQGTDIKALTSNWENTYTTFSIQSANNTSVYSTVNTNSGAWGTGGSGADNEVRALTANWQNTYTNFSTQSSNNLSVYSTVQTNSATWGSGGGNTAVDTLVTTTSGNWNSVYSTVNSNSGTWGGGGGGGSAGWTLIATSSANNTTNIIFDNVFTDAYDHYMVTVYQAKCTSSGNNLNMYWRLSGTDVKLDTTGATHLFYGGSIFNEGNSNSTGYGHKLTYFGRTFSGTNQSANGFATFQPRLLEVKNVAFEMRYFETTSGPVASLLRGYSTMAAPSAMTGCGFAFFSGNISTGVFAVYGLKKTL